jgi:hypothetical protein
VGFLTRECATGPQGLSNLHPPLWVLPEDLQPSRGDLAHAASRPFQRRQGVPRVQPGAADDSAHHAGDPTSNTQDVVDMLERWRQYITGWVFGRVFGMLSRDGSPL